MLPLATEELNDTPTYLKQQQDGLWEETRFHFKPGDRVRTTRGPYEGQEAVIDTLVGVTLRQTTAIGTGRLATT